MHSYEHLLLPFQVGPLIFRNRIISAPTSVALLEDRGRIGPDTIAYYEQKAMGGCAVVTVGESIVRIRDGRSHPRQIPLDDPNERTGLTQLADAIHAHGAYASIQLSHGGGLCPPMFIEGNAIGPSDIIKDKEGTCGHPSPFDSHIHGMTEEEIEEIADCFGRAAAVVRCCGFDMCMVHGGHGWLIHQFLSPLTNFRKDKFGGSLENRARFALMVIERIRKYAGPDFPIEFRMSGSERCEGGYDIQTGIEYAKLLDGIVDLIHVSAGTQESLYSEVLMHPSVFQKHGENVNLAAEIRKHVKTPIVAVGALSEPDKMEEILATGKADVLALGRGLIADPYLPKKIASGNAEDVTVCLRCHECMGAMMTKDSLCCTVNPSIGREVRFQAVRPAQVKKKVLVAGGGPAGMSAAIYAARRGHDVTLCEKSSRLGGALHFADSIDFKQAIFQYEKQLERRLNLLPIKVRMDTTVNEEFVNHECPDVLFAAVGAIPIIPPIPGVNRENVLLASSLNAGVIRDKTVVVVGGGLIGCELAVELQKNGCRCTIVEMTDTIAAGSPHFHHVALLEELKKIDRIFAGAKCTSIDNIGIHIEGADGKMQILPADYILLACGMRANTELEALRTRVTRYIPIGDCYRAGKIGNAVTQAFDMVLDMEY